MRRQHHALVTVLGGGVSDVVAPTCVITCDVSSPSAAATFNYTITFSEVVTGFIVDDFVVTNGSKAALGGSGAVYTCTVTPTTAATPVTANVAAGVAIDAAGNENTAAAQLSIEYYSVIYYVAKTGSDAYTTAQAQNPATPWLTLAKALASASAGHLVRIGNGTYTENTGGNWSINKNLANWLTFEPQLGASGSVIVARTSGSYDTQFGFGTTSAYLRFRYMNMGCMRTQGAWSNLYFDHCSFVDSALASIYITPGNNALSNVTFSYCTTTNTGAQGVNITISGTGTCTGLLFDNCTIAGSGANAVYGVAIASAVGGAVAFTNCTISAGAGFTANGMTTTMTNCIVNTTHTANAVVFGIDGSAGGNATTAIITNLTINRDATKIGHTMIFGHGCVNCHVDDVTIPQSYDYGIVLKEHTGTEIENSTVTGGTSSAILYKAVASPNVHNNIFNGVGTVGAFQLRNGDTGNKCSDWQFQNNVVNVSGEAKALNIGNDTHDLGGGICDYNTYENNSGLGVVRNDGAVADLTELQAAWADYDVTTNDSHSEVV